MSTTNGHSQLSTTLPRFSSIHEQPDHAFSYAASSNASSSRSTVYRSQPRSERSDGFKSKDDLGVKEEDFAPQQESQVKHHHGNGAIRRLKRASGGFLLDTSPTSSRLSRSILGRKGVKGKEKEEDQPVKVARRRPHVDGVESRSSVGASPLSSEVTSSPAPHGRSVAVQNNASDASRLHPADGSVRSHGSSLRPHGAAYGFDTDPAQIVEMALRLNEGRRRQASRQRYVSNASNVSEGRRILSAATSLPARSSPSDRSDTFKRRRFSPEPITSQRRAREIKTGSIEERSISTEAWSPEQDVGLDADMQISRATQNRVAKAKTYFELAYEHRRLLSHLPPLRHPDSSNIPRMSGYNSKAYNPLQYARNRKLRFRERSTLNPEAEGWHDILKVRAWVNAVISSHHETEHDPLECVRLPPLTLLEKDGSELDNDSNNGSRRKDHLGRPRRPRSDWVTHPGDLLADAFWTEQGLNKQKIYNRDNEPIYPAGTKFLFSGWRNRTPVNVPDELKSSSSPETSPTFDRKQSVPDVPDLPTFQSAHKDHGWARTRSKFNKALNTRSRSKRKRDHDIFDTSSDSSSSSEYTERRQSRGRKRRAKRQDKLNLSDGDPFAGPVRSADPGSRALSSDVDTSQKASTRNSIDHSNFIKRLKRNSTGLSHDSDNNTKAKLHKRRGFLQNIKFDTEHDRRHSSIDYDSTTPPTPSVPTFTSIAINLSPPHSRSVSPEKKQKQSFLGAVKDMRHGQKDHIDRTDFARDGGSSKGSSERLESHSRARNTSHDVSRGTSPMTRGVSPFAHSQSRTSLDEGPTERNEQRGSTISKVSTRIDDSGPHRSHRVRGMFKGGRIAELVGNEVSRVGDFIWKREPPRRSDMVDDGSTSGYESDSDELPDDQNKIRKRPDEFLSKSTHQSAKNGSPSSPVTRSPPYEAPQFHIQGLPSFTSPFQRDRDAQEQKTGSQSPGGTSQREEGQLDGIDPIATASAARKAAGRSPRFNRLAPPKLDIRAATPDGRRSSYGFGTALGLERARSASQLYNSAISGSTLEPQLDENNTSSRSAKEPQTASRSRADPTKTARRESGLLPGQNITMQDMLRIRSLLVAVAVKATNMTKFANDIPRHQSLFLYSAFQTTSADGSDIEKYLPLRRREEHMVAGRHLITHLNNQAAILNENLNDFTLSTTMNLHKEIQALEDEADTSLFPRLQELSDTAGQLAQKLITTSALAVKGVNDEVSGAMRLKSRGPQRLVRWLGYKIIEWGVVSCLWLIWFVVTIIRLSISVVKAIFAVVAWLFWLR